jgi:large subunit ribosomal protein L18
MNNTFLQRKIRTRAKVTGTAARPRLTVFKSNKYLVAQIINDDKGVTLASANDMNLGKIAKLGKNKADQATEVGKTLAEKALKLKIKDVVFDKSGNKYHGKIKAVAEAARKAGLNF